MRSSSLACLLWIASVGAAYAVDHPIAGNLIRLEDPPDIARRLFFFRTVKQAQINEATVPDPTVGGATLQVAGSGVGDGDTGILSLPAVNWGKLRNGGYYYRDHSAANGVSQVRLKPRSSVGGSLHIGGRTANWPYQVTQPQTDIRLKLTIGADVYCATFTDLQPNRDGIALGKKNPPPLSCN